MKRYYVTENEVWPALGLEEIAKDTSSWKAQHGFEIPADLVRRFNRAKKAYHDAEQAIIKHIDAESWFGR